LSRDAAALLAAPLEAAGLAKARGAGALCFLGSSHPSSSSSSSSLSSESDIKVARFSCSVTAAETLTGRYLGSLDGWVARR
jgi:hypothetical protein